MIDTVPASAKRNANLHSEAGFTLVEVLVTCTLMVVMLIAIASVLDTGGTVAARDNERAATLSEANTGLLKLTNELRRACAIFPSSGGASSNYCGSSTAFAPGTDMCATSPATSSNCIDFVLPGRPSDGLVWRRVIYNCSVTDSSAATGITKCMRYATASTSTQTALATAPTTTTASRTTAVLRGVANSTGSPSIFTYCLNSDYQSSSCTSGTTASTAQVVRVTIDVTRKGTRKTGLSGSFRLDDAVNLWNINRETS